MKDILALLRLFADAHGLSGYEDEVAALLKKELEPLVDEVTIDKMGNVIGVRRGDGPTLLGAATYRFLGHSRADPSAYRDKIEEERWKQRDPVVLARRALAVAGAADEAELEALETAIARELDAAVAEAEASPPATVDEAIAGMYATPIGGMR